MTEEDITLFKELCSCISKIVKEYPLEMQREIFLHLKGRYELNSETQHYDYNGRANAQDLVDVLKVHVKHHKEKYCDCFYNYMTAVREHAEYLVNKAKNVIHDRLLVDFEQNMIPRDRGGNYAK